MPHWPEAPRNLGPCELCGREKPRTFHHLIPRRLHRKGYALRQFGKEEMQTRGLLLCRACHRKVHQLFDERTLGLEYNTKEKLLAVPALQKFLAWVKKQR